MPLLLHVHLHLQLHMNLHLNMHLYLHLPLPLHIHLPMHLYLDNAAMPFLQSSARQWRIIPSFRRRGAWLMAYHGYGVAIRYSRIYP